MTVAETINRKVRDALAIDHLEVVNESHMHNVPKDSETHFKLVVVSDAFAGKMPVRRHQMLYGLLDDELKGPVHALALHTFTPQEWQQREQTAADSPACRGGSKHDPEFHQ
jgi:BolA protein